MVIKYQESLTVERIKNNWFIISNPSSCDYLYNNWSCQISALPLDIARADILKIIEYLGQAESDNSPEYFTPKKYLGLKKPTRLMIFMTSKCNLRCIYCHCNSTTKGQNMDEELALKIVDKYVAHVKQIAGTTKDTVKITFMGGGEPLLQINVIKKIVAHLESQGIQGDYVLVSNGTLGNNNDWNWLVEKKFRITLSIDGDPKTHNNQRIFSDSKFGTWTAVEKKLDFLSSKNAKIHARSTVTDTRNIEYSCEYLEQFDCIETHSLEPVSIAGRGMKCHHYPNDLKGFYSQFFLAYSTYLYRNPSRYKSAWFKPFKRMDGFCGAVYHNAVVTHDGYVSLCTEVDSSVLDTPYGNQFIVSHVNDGEPFLSKKSSDFSSAHSIDNMENCKDCAIKYKCGGGCYVKRYRDLSEQEDFYNSFCRNVIKLNLSYLLAMYEQHRNE